METYEVSWDPTEYIILHIAIVQDDDEKRYFNLKEALWFCMTSLTPQGGGEAPKNLSGDTSLTDDPNIDENTDNDDP